MITEITLACGNDDSEEITNGINLKIYRVDDEDNVTVSFEDDGGKPILLFTFEISFEELLRGVLQLNAKF